MHGDKWGPLGSLLAALCCLGFAPLTGALSAVGLGFFLSDLILIPLPVLFLSVTVAALMRDRARHGRPGPVRRAVVAGLLTVGGLWASGIVVALGLGLLVVASVWNWLALRDARSNTRRAPQGA